MQQAIVLQLAISTAVLSGVACSGVHPQVHADFLDGLSHGTTLSVFPAVVREGTSVARDIGISEGIAAHLRRTGIDARVVHRAVPTGEWHVEDARLARESASALAASVKADPIDTRYALAPEVLIGADGQVAGVHAYVARSDGEVAGILLLNSHSPIYQSIRPASPVQCTEVIIAAIDDYWRQP